MHRKLQEFNDKFRVAELKLYESEHWIWSLRPVQCTLGAGVLSMKSYAERLSEMSPAAGSDLAATVTIIENTLSKAFEYDKINYLMLMMVDPHVHCHVVPRYSRAVECCGRTWNDVGWPALPDLAQDQADAATLTAVHEELSKHVR